MRDASVQCSRDVATKNCSDYQLLIHTAVPGPYLPITGLSINIVTWRADTGQGKLNRTPASLPPYPISHMFSTATVPYSGRFQVLESRKCGDGWKLWAAEIGDQQSGAAPTHTSDTVETLLTHWRSHDERVFHNNHQASRPPITSTLFRCGQWTCLYQCSSALPTDKVGYDVSDAERPSKQHRNWAK